MVRQDINEKKATLISSCSPAVWQIVIFVLGGFHDRLISECLKCTSQLLLWDLEATKWEAVLALGVAIQGACRSVGTAVTAVYCSSS